jgi:hypothetical protein
LSLIPSLVIIKDMAEQNKEECNNTDLHDENVKTLNEKIEKSISFKRAFLIGIVRGIGVTIGATIVAGIVLGALSFTIDRAEEIPILSWIIEWFQIDRFLNK